MEKTQDKLAEKTWRQKLSMAANYVVKAVGAVIFVFLAWYGLRYTNVVMPGGREIPLELRDSLWKNLLAVMFACALMAVLLVWEKRLSQKVQGVICGISVVLTMLWIGAVGLWWISAAVRVPTGDCAFVYGGASYFLEGEYGFLEGTRGYCAMYPHQLGLIALTELLFLVIGTYNFYGFQVMCVLFSMGIVLAGYLVLREYAKGISVTVIYCVMMGSCLPLAFYTGWVYGDLPSIFFALMAVWMLLCYGRCKKTGWLVGMVLMVTMAMLNRKNTMIFVVALCLVVLVYVLKRFDKKLFLATLLCVLIPWLAYTGIYKMYELRSGVESYPGLPVVTWIEMGLHEVEGVCGWYDNSPKELYYSTGDNVELTKELAMENIKERLQEFVAQPSYGVDFFKRKILSQWNTPLYQSVFFATMYSAENIPPAESLVSKVEKEYFSGVLAFCDRLQFVVYFGFLLYFLLGIKRESNILFQLLAVTVIGGFLFSILWEAKARYILPYYMMMFPCAVVGYGELSVLLGGAVRKISCFFKKEKI